MLIVKMFRLINFLNKNHLILMCEHLLVSLITKYDNTDDKEYENVDMILITFVAFFNKLYGEYYRV